MKKYLVAWLNKGVCIDEDWYEDYAYVLEYCKEYNDGYKIRGKGTYVELYEKRNDELVLLYGIESK